MKKQNLILFFVIVFISLSCKNEAELTRTEMITKVWKVQSVHINGTPDYLNDYSSYRFDFKVGGQYLSVNPMQNDGTWAFNESETMIILQTANGNEEVEILELTDKRLKLQFIEPANDKQGEQVIVYTLVPA